MYSKYLFYFIFIISLVVFQLSFISGLPLGLDKFNLILVVLIFILILKSFRQALWWLLGLAVFLDIYSFLPFGFYLVCFFLVFILTNFLLVNFFTNRSLYSFLALTFFSTIFYEILLNSMIYILGLISARINFFILTKEFWINIPTQIILNLLFVFLFFHIFSFISFRLKPMFLVGDKK